MQRQDEGSVCEWEVEGGLALDEPSGCRFLFGEVRFEGFEYEALALSCLGLVVLLVKVMDRGGLKVSWLFWYESKKFAWFILGAILSSIGYVSFDPFQ